MLKTIVFALPTIIAAVPNPRLAPLPSCPQGDIAETQDTQDFVTPRGFVDEREQMLVTPPKQASVLTPWSRAWGPHTYVQCSSFVEYGQMTDVWCGMFFSEKIHRVQVHYHNHSQKPHHQHAHAPSDTDLHAHASVSHRKSDDAAAAGHLHEHAPDHHAQHEHVSDSQPVHPPPTIRRPARPRFFRSPPLSSTTTTTISHNLAVVSRERSRERSRKRSRKRDLNTNEP